MENELEIMLAMQDDDFQKILKNDDELNRLDKLKNSDEKEYLELMAVISKKYFICGIHVMAITPIIWSYLYCIGNKIVRNEKPEKIDIDVFVYLLANGINAVDQNLFENAKDFFLNKNVDYISILLEIKEMIELAFRANEMLESMNKNEQPTRFNLDWLTSIVSIVSNETNKDSDYIMFNMSLTECMYYVIQYCRKNSPDENKYKRKNSIEINALMFQRTLELGKEYYNNKYKG